MLAGHYAPVTSDLGSRQARRPIGSHPPTLVAPREPQSVCPLLNATFHEVVVPRCAC